MSKHTPGPWEHGRNFVPNTSGANILVVRPVGEFPHGRWIADVGRGDEESTANATLIASAPDMRAELERVAEELDEWANEDCNYQLRANAMRARLASICAVLAKGEKGE